MPRFFIEHVRELLAHIEKRLSRQIGIALSALFEEGCRFNDEIHKWPSGDKVCITKGVYRYRSHEEAKLHWDACLSGAMAKIERTK